jgi:hypothetical protein
MSDDEYDKDYFERMYNPEAFKKRMEQYDEDSRVSRLEHEVLMRKIEAQEKKSDELFERIEKSYVKWDLELKKADRSIDEAKLFIKFLKYLSCYFRKN